MKSCFNSPRVLFCFLLITTATCAAYAQPAAKKDIRSYAVPPSFQKADNKNAQAEAQKQMRAGAKRRDVILALKKKNHMAGALLSAIRVTQTPPVDTSAAAPPPATVTVEQIADDVALLLDVDPQMTPVAVIAAIRELYGLGLADMLPIAALVVQNGRKPVNAIGQYFYFAGICHRIQTNTTDPYYKVIQSSGNNMRSVTEQREPWQRFLFWKTGLEETFLTPTTLNSYIQTMSASSFPLYAGLRTAWLQDPQLNFRTAFGTTPASLVPLLECTAIMDMPLRNDRFDEALHTNATMAINNMRNYTGIIDCIVNLKGVWRLADVLPVLKRNGFTMEEMATAVKSAFVPADADMRRILLDSFRESDFTAAEKLRVAHVMNDN
jgi:hypothetical protein